MNHTPKSPEVVELEEQMFRAKYRARNALDMCQWEASSWERRELRQLTKLRDDVLAREQAERERKAEAARRAVLTEALRPGHVTFARFFHEELNAHAITVAFEHRIAVKRWYLGSAARRSTRTITVAPPLNEDTYAIFLHEVGHILDPEADGEQQRHTIDVERGPRHEVLTVNTVSPLAEAAAWHWAIRHAYRWTFTMQQRLCRALQTYERGATPYELDVMKQVKTEAGAAVLPAPDTAPGRELRLAAAYRETKRVETLMRLERHR
jgi:hypothetical protein